MKLKRFFAISLILVILLSLCPALAAEEDESGGADEVLELVDQILLRDRLETLLAIIEAYSLYDYEGGEEVLLDALAAFFTAHPDMFEEFANDLYQTQDEYSHYMEPTTYDSSYVLVDSFVGIGVELDPLRDGLIVAVIPNSPAEEAGVKAGDMIYSADGEVLENTYYQAVQEKLRGEEGTEISLGVKRGGELIEFVMTRRKVELSNISVEDLGNGVAYVRIAHFGDMPDTFIDFVNAYCGLPDEGFKSVIFDVRDNSGGSLDTLLNILNYTFWEADLPMFALRFRDEDEPEVYYSLGAGWEPENIVVLTNSNTASAAELFAGALGYMEGAWIVGEDDFTYGKGVGQSHIELTDGSYAVITTMEVLVGEDISYNGEGIPSDITVVAEDGALWKDDIEPLNCSREMFSGARGKNALAVEQRLALLGYTRDLPNGTLDDDEFAAIERFRDDNGLAHRGFVDRATLEALDAALENAPEAVAADAALMEALAWCVE